MVDNHNPKVTRYFVGIDEEVNVLSGRERVSIWKKLNPFWWPWNDVEPTPPDWYEPNATPWKRSLKWWFRNPFGNFTSYVLGVKDYDYTIHGKAPLDIGTLADVNKMGFKVNIIYLPRAPRRWISTLLLVAALASMVVFWSHFWVFAIAGPVVLYCLPFIIGKLPFVSYAGKRVLWYLGWQWEGGLCAKFNLRNSSVQIV